MVNIEETLQKLDDIMSLLVVVVQRLDIIEERIANIDASINPEFDS